jgi:hypothetical protein
MRMQLPPQEQPASTTGYHDVANGEQQLSSAYNACVATPAARVKPISLSTLAGWSEVSKPDWTLVKETQPRFAKETPRIFNLLKRGAFKVLIETRDCPG